METGDESATGSVNLFNRPELRLGHEDAADPRGVFVLVAKARENSRSLRDFVIPQPLRTRPPARTFPLAPSTERE